ncbi:hypothetical protein VPH35_075295 [Triticum aestivum]
MQWNHDMHICFHFQILNLKCLERDNTKSCDVKKWAGFCHPGVKSGVPPRKRIKKRRGREGNYGSRAESREQRPDAAIPTQTAQPSITVAAADRPAPSPWLAWRAGGSRRAAPLSEAEPRCPLRYAASHHSLNFVKNTTCSCIKPLIGKG